jgi:hypothetical protein
MNYTEHDECSALRVRQVCPIIRRGNLADTNKERDMAHWKKAALFAVTLLMSTCAVQAARGNEPPADLCSLLPAAEVSKTLGHDFDAPEKTVAPRPFMNTNAGTDCRYKRSKDPRERTFFFRIYIDSSAAQAKDLFAQLTAFSGKAKSVDGLGDEAYFDKYHGLHVRKGKVRFYLTMDDPDEKLLTALASHVLGQL